MDCKEVRNHLIEHDGIRDCPLCREHLKNCPECAAEADFLFELSKGLGGIAAKSQHPSPVEFEARLIHTCKARQRFVHNDWNQQTFFRRSIVAAVVIFFIFSSMLFFIPSASNSSNTTTKHSFVAVNSDFNSIINKIENTFGVDITTFPQAKKTAWSRNISLFIPEGTKSEVARAAARAFDLELMEIDNKLFIVDRATAFLCAEEADRSKRREVKLDLQFALQPDEFSRMDRIANMMISVDDLKFNAPISKSARIPFIKNDSDVTVLKRPDETFEVRRALPWIMVDSSSGKLEFVAVTEEDLERFNAIRELLRELDKEKPGSLPTFSFPDSLMSAMFKPGANASLSEVLATISKQFELNIIVGTGADLSLSTANVPSGEISVPAYLDKVLASSPYYFAVLDDGKTLMIDEKANLQRYLKVQVIKATEGTSAPELEQRIQAAFPQYFNTNDKRSGALSAVFRDYVIIRHHSYPLSQILESLK